MMDFGALPPEVNSTAMYSGAGSSPLRSAASAWQALAADLESSAAETRALVAGLDTAWQGPSADAMTAKMASHVSWLTNTAAMAQSTGAQAQAAAAAYQAAYAATVNPANVSQNRVELATLVSTNILGQNTAAIMANEAEYSEMWAQDAAAMYAYHAQSAAATTALQTPAAPAASLSSIFGVTPGEFLEESFQSLLSGGLSVPTSILSLFTVLWAVSTPGNAVGDALRPKNNNTFPVIEPEPVVPVVPKPTSGTTGIAGRIGSLSVPPSWASSATTAQAPEAGRFVPYGAGEPGSPMGVMPMGGAGRQSQEERRQQPRYGQKLTVMPDVHI